MLHHITVYPGGTILSASSGSCLLTVLRNAGLSPDAPCGGEGRCGKCSVTVNGISRLSCKTIIDRDMTVCLPNDAAQQILSSGIEFKHLQGNTTEDYHLAIDIGTTTIVGYLLNGSTGCQLATISIGNPQAGFGADVVTRIRLAVHGQMEILSSLLRQCLEDMTAELCRQAGIQPAQVRTLIPVGNPAMQQFFLGLSVDNLAKYPFAPILTETGTLPTKGIIPILDFSTLLVVPNIDGFVGADTVACILSCGMDASDDLSLLVDIGTNGEMVLGNRHAMVACSTAAGPALEGAGIRFGMRAKTGAIDHVWLDNGEIQCSVIGDGPALGICGSGLIDATAAALEAGWLNQRGRILTEDRTIRLRDGIYLDQ